VRDRKQDGTQFARRGGGVYGSVMKQLLNRRETATTKATNTGSGRREQISKIIVGKFKLLGLFATCYCSVVGIRDALKG
jgi:hypothetical protein